MCAHAVIPQPDHNAFERHIQSLDAEIALLQNQLVRVVEDIEALCPAQKLADEIGDLSLQVKDVVGQQQSIRRDSFVRKQQRNANRELLHRVTQVLGCTSQDEVDERLAAANSELSLRQRSCERSGEDKELLTEIAELTCGRSLLSSDNFSVVVGNDHEAAGIGCNLEGDYQTDANLESLLLKQTELRSQYQRAMEDGWERVETASKLQVESHELHCRILDKAWERARLYDKFRQHEQAYRTFIDGNHAAAPR